MLCFLESGDGKLARHSGKPLEKLFKCFSAFQIVEEVLDGDSGSAKRRSSAKNIPPRIVRVRKKGRDGDRALPLGPGFSGRLFAGRGQFTAKKGTRHLAHGFLADDAQELNFDG